LISNADVSVYAYLLSRCPYDFLAQVTLDQVILRGSEIRLVFLMMFTIMLIPVGFRRRQHVVSTSHTETRERGREYATT
jgi:hypothetical protein